MLGLLEVRDSLPGLSDFARFKVEDGVCFLVEAEGKVVFESHVIGVFSKLVHSNLLARCEVLLSEMSLTQVHLDLKAFRALGQARLIEINRVVEVAFSHPQVGLVHHRVEANGLVRLTVGEKLVDLFRLIDLAVLCEDVADAQNSVGVLLIYLEDAEVLGQSATELLFLGVDFMPLHAAQYIVDISEADESICVSVTR